MSAIPLFPLNTVLYPDGFLALQIFEVRYLDMVKRCIEHGEEFGVVALVQGEEVRKPGGHETLSAIGTRARIDEWKAPIPGLMHVTCVGTRRFHITTAEVLKHGLWIGEVTEIPPDIQMPIPDDQQVVADMLGSLIRSLQERGITGQQMPMRPPYRLDDAGWVANRWCELLRLNLAQKQLLLSQENPLLRLELVQDVLVDHGLLN